MGLRTLLGKLAYGSLFVLALPSLLWSVATQLDASAWVSWPVPLSGFLAIFIACVGATLMVWSMLLLWTDGKGLPMNAYPTTQLVSRSTYRWVSHPIYTGFVLLVIGCSAWLQSPTGFWLMSPLCVLASFALVVGYEGPLLLQRFGESALTPWLGLPQQGGERPTWKRTLGAIAISLGPWAFLYWSLSHVPTPVQAVDMRMNWEYQLPQPDWAVWAYSALYPLGIAAVFVLPSQTRLRQWVLAAWVSTALGFVLMIGLPNQAEFLGNSRTGAEAWLLEQNRLYDAEWMAAPSFHAAWAVLTACAFSSRWPRFRLGFWLATTLVSASCILTGSHALVDVLLGVLLGMLAWRHERVWSFLITLTERLGNSWSSTRLGQVRFINHWVWSFLAASVGTLTVLWMAGPHSLLPTVVVLASGLLGAGAWGYWLEGGHRLSRPFGYYGYLLTSAAALAACGMAGVQDTGMLIAAFGAAAPFAQAIGRLRCVVQGCCHGRPVLSAQGIRIRNKMSRVTALAGFCDKAIHPTQLYSIVGNLILGLMLARLWQANAPWTLIVGLYLVLSSLARFTEEQFRGEPQTKTYAGLTVYQWLAAVLFASGLILMGIPAQAVASASWLDKEVWVAAVASGAVAAFLMSVDFPNSRKRFSRLTVAPPQASIEDISNGDVLPSKHGAKF